MSNPFQPMASHYDHAYARLSDDDESDSRRSPTPHHSKAKLRRGKGKGKGKSPPEGEAKINPAVEEKNEETEGEPGREGGERRHNTRARKPPNPQLAAWTSAVKSILLKARAPDALLVMQHIFMTVDPLAPSDVFFCQWVLMAQDRRS